MDASGEQRLSIEQLLLYVRNHNRDIYFIPVILIPIGLGMNNWFSWPVVLSWMLVVLITLFITTLLYRYILQHEADIDHEQQSRYCRYIAFIRLPYLLSWSTVILWAWVPSNPENHVFQVLISAGVIAATAMMSSPLKRILIYEMVLCTAPLLIRFYMEGDIYLMMGMMSFWFAILMLSLSYEMRKSFTRTLQLQIDNQQLIVSLEHLATIDSLTNIHNRRSFLEQANKSRKYVRRHQGRFGIAVIDVDHFKSINDNYGHAAGDEVLKSVASLLKQEIRESDTIGRLGGEEFAILFMDVDTQALAELVRRLVEKLASTRIKVDDNPLAVTISAGISLYRDDDSIESLLHRADVAMYQAKDAGRNRISIG